SEVINKLPTNKTVIAIDACLGQVSSIGTTQVIKGSLSPGAGVKKKLPKVGDYAISPIINVGGFMEYIVLQNTRLSLVMQLAKDITSAIIKRFPLEYAEDNKIDCSISDDILVNQIKEKGLEARLVKNK